MSRPIKIRDRRNRGWFFIDNDYINGYGKYFGPIGISIYIILCRHVNIDQRCYPSQEQIADKIGVTSRTVRDYLKKLVTFNMIHIEKQRTGGKWLNNLYVLLDKDEWIIPSEAVSHGDHRKLSTSSSEIDDINRRKLLPTKYTNRKDTNIRKERNIKSENWNNIERTKKEIRKKYKVSA